MKPKIAYGLFDFHLGGIETFLKNIATRLNHSYDFHFIATASNQILPIFNQIGTAHYCPPTNLVQFYQKLQPDILQVHQEQAQIDAAIQAKIKVIIERTDGNRSCTRLKKDALKCVIASAKGTIPLIKQVCPKSVPIHLIYNGLDLNLIDQIPKNNLYQNGEFVVGRSSRFGWGKNIQLLIEAIKILSEKYKDIRLCLIGGDSVLPNAEKNLPKLQALAKGYERYIQFLGYQENVIAYTKRFDVGTCVSRPNNEGIPNSLMESMACSKPVIATNVDQVSELVSPENGILITDNNLNQLVEAIEYLYLNRDVGIQKGLVGRRTIEEKFNMDVCAEQYHQIYQANLKK